MFIKGISFFFFGLGIWDLRSCSTCPMARSSSILACTSKASSYTGLLYRNGMILLDVINFYPFIISVISCRYMRKHMIISCSQIYYWYLQSIDQCDVHGFMPFMLCGYARMLWTQWPIDSIYTGNVRQHEPINVPANHNASWLDRSAE